MSSTKENESENLSLLFTTAWRLFGTNTPSKLPPAYNQIKSNYFKITEDRVFTTGKYIFLRVHFACVFCLWGGDVGYLWLRDYFPGFSRAIFPAWSRKRRPEYRSHRYGMTGNIIDKSLKLIEAEW